jgi:hypothetical protein
MAISLKKSNLKNAHSRNKAKASRPGSSAKSGPSAKSGTSAKTSPSANRSGPSVKAKPNSKAKRSAIVKTDVVDQMILKLAGPPVKKILNQFKIGKKRLSDDRRLAIELGTRILEKAKLVRDSIIQRTRAARGR